MKQKIKLFLIGIAGLFTLFTIIGLVMPSSVKISRGVIVAADSAAVTQTIMDVKTWQSWMTWLESTEGSLVRFEQSDGKPVIRWNHLGGKQSGEIIMYGIEGDLIRMQYAFPGMNTADGGIRIKKINERETEILWMVEYPLRWFPWERFEGIFLDALIGQQLEDSLKRLQDFMEQSV
jgi:uncharacterized membrane protein